MDNFLKTCFMGLYTSNMWCMFGEYMPQHIGRYGNPYIMHIPLYSQILDQKALELAPKALRDPIEKIVHQFPHNITILCIMWAKTAEPLHDSKRNIVLHPIAKEWTGLRDNFSITVNTGLFASADQDIKTISIAFNSYGQLEVNPHDGAFSPDNGIFELPHTAQRGFCSFWTSTYVDAGMITVGTSPKRAEPHALIVFNLMALTDRAQTQLGLIQRSCVQSEYTQEIRCFKKNLNDLSNQALLKEDKEALLETSNVISLLRTSSEVSLKEEVDIESLKDLFNDLSTCVLVVT